MADFLFDITTYSDAETNFLSGGGSQTLSSGDRLGFRWTTHSGGNQPSNVYVSGWSSTGWTCTSSAALTLGGGYVYHTVLSHPTEQSDVLSITATMFDSATFTAYVSDGIDNVPTAFTLGPSVVGANPNNVYYSRTFVLAGMSNGTSATVSATGTAELSKDGVTYTSGTLLVYNDDRVWTRMAASTSYGTSVNTTVSVTGVNSYWAISTIDDPATGTILQFGHETGNVPLSDVKAFFGGGDNLGSYRRDEFVPTISPENDDIVSDPNAWLRLTRFRGSVTAFYWSVPPTNKHTNGDTMQGSLTYYLTWQSTTDWQLGYGTGMTDTCEYKFEFLEQWKETLAGGAVANSDVQMNSVSNTIWGANNKTLVIRVTPSVATEAFYDGIIRCSARNPIDTSIVVTADVHYNYAFSAN